MDFMKSTALELLSSLWVIQTACTLLLLRLSQRLYLVQRRKLDDGMERMETKRVALVIPVKGISDNFPRFMDFALGQDYPDYHVIFVVESENDPACGPIRQKIHGHNHARIIVAGEAASSGQKVHNQLAAFKHLEAGDRIVAFADGDLVASENWLSDLSFPLNQGHADCTTGYRWFIPENQRLPNRVIALIGTAIEPLLGPGWRMCLWGGSMAMSREAFDEMEVPRNLEGSVNDDLRITQLAKRAGKRMRYTRTVAALTPVDFTWASLLEFGRRQYFQVRIYQPSLWLRALLIPLLHLVSFSVCLLRLVQGDFWMLGYFGAAVTLNAFRTKVRREYLKERFTDGGVEALDAAVKSSWWMDTMVNAVHLFIVFSAACGRIITWAGIRYKVTGPQKTEIIRRACN
jgi:cellulose synthase/poly-beta-1,6-N-acetylglucosamine synthase-like glycosyltransferase